MKVLSIFILLLSAAFVAARPRLFQRPDTSQLVAKLEQMAKALDKLSTISHPDLGREAILADLDQLIALIDVVQEMERNGSFGHLAGMVRDLEGRRVVLRIIAKRMQ